MQPTSLPGKIVIALNDSKSVCRPWRPPTGGGAHFQLPSPSRRAVCTTNDRPPRAGERFYIQVEFALTNCHKSKYRVVGQFTRRLCSRRLTRDPNLIITFFFCVRLNASKYNRAGQMTATVLAQFSSDC